MNEATVDNKGRRFVEDVKDPVYGNTIGPRFECCNPNGHLAATVVGCAMSASR